MPTTFGVLDSCLLLFPPLASRRHREKSPEMVPLNATSNGNGLAPNGYSGRAQGEAKMGEKECVFCDVRRELGFKIVYEDDMYIAFEDRSPGSKVHLLLIPRQHIKSVKTLRKADVPLVAEMKQVGEQILVEHGVPLGQQRLGFHIPPAYSVPHLHLHLLSLPVPFPGSIKYRPSFPSLPLGKTREKGFAWFVTVEQVERILAKDGRVGIGWS